MAMRFHTPLLLDNTSVQLNGSNRVETIMATIAAALAGQSYLDTSGDSITINPAAIGVDGISHGASWEETRLENGSQNKFIGPLALHQAPSTLSAWGVVDISSGTPSIVKSWNITSVTKNGTGDYTATFTNAMADSYYAVGGGAGNETNVPYFVTPYFQQAPTTTNFRMGIRDNNMNTSDIKWLAFMVSGQRA
ncbi:MAG: hypothetical protein OXR68_00075 [Alphaproteobacteria bacterium]|nr:hypothetical protein [Alphaproteobacteria bacterium]MDD9919007.1 hypothetical protein [Alphaproteobacteria bacterium]